MRMRSYFSALKVEAADAAKFGGMEGALQDAQQLAVGSPAGCLAAAKPRQKSSTETSVMGWAREMEQQFMASGKLWAVRVDGTVGLGMPQQQFVAGGDFASALSEAAKAKLADVRRELREVGAEIALITPVHHNVPLSAQQPIRESGAVLLIGGVSSDASSPAVMPMLRTMGLSPYATGAVAPSQPLPVEGGQASSAPASVVSLGDLTVLGGAPATASGAPCSCMPCQWHW